MHFLHIYRLTFHRHALVGLLLAVGIPMALFGATAVANDDGEFFEKHVRPIFVNNCGQCHGADEHKSGCDRFRDAILHGGKRGAAAVAGKPQESLLIHALRRDGELKMPKDKDALPEPQIEILERWIGMGMPWPKENAVSDAPKFTAEQRSYWAFQPIGKVTPPEVKDAAWVRTDVDHFILAALEGKGLSPAPAADKRTLLRRATFDLIGLPPTPDEIDAFLKDGSPDAFSKVVDRLLASPHYGERWGRHWLGYGSFCR